MATKAGRIINISMAKRQLIMKSTIIIVKNNKAWLSKFRKSTTTVAKLSVSEVMRLTTFADENISKKDKSLSITAANASLRNCNTISPTIRAVNHSRNNLQTHESTDTDRIIPTKFNN